MGRNEHRKTHELFQEFDLRRRTTLLCRIEKEIVEIRGDVSEN